MCPTPAYGDITRQSQYQEQEQSIPRKPEAPLDLRTRRAPLIPHCERYFTHDGKKLECDSQQGLDAGRLRMIVHEVPESVAELDAYYRTQKNIRYVAYVGTLGIVSVILGSIMSNPIAASSSGGLKPSGYLTIIGASLVTGAFIYGFGMSRTSEAHVGKAVEYYNKKYPDRPIGLEFDTSVHF